MTTRNFEIQEVVSDNIVRRKTINLDEQAPAADRVTIPNAIKAYTTVTNQGDNISQRTILDFVDLPISFADDAGQAQYGGVQIMTFPEGLIFTKGAIISGDLTLGVTGTFIDAFTGVNALGSVVASTGATLTSTEATYLQSTANATAAAKVAAIDSFSIATALTETSSRIVNGTTTPAPVFLNFAIADDASHTAGTGKFTGRVIISWEKIGDLL